MHTNSPRKMLWDLKDKGVITYQKVDDMVRQNQTVTNRRWNIALVTDSSCDLPQEIIDLYQIHVVPLNINFGDRHYLDKVTVGGDQFYELLNSKGEFPSTSQINERVFMDLYTHLASHYDAIISVHMTHHFSGTYKNSKMAAYKIASKFSKPVYSIDSHNLSGALGLLVLKTARAIEGGMPLEILKENIEKWRTQLKIFVSVKNLKHMIRSGRVSRPKGIVANWMGVTPIVSMDKNGRSMLFGKSFSQRENMNRIVEHIRKISEGKNIWNYIVLHAHNREGADKYVMKMQQVTGKNPVAVVDISPVIGMFAGPGTTAVSLLYE